MLVVVLYLDGLRIFTAYVGAWVLTVSGDRSVSLRR